MRTQNYNNNDLLIKNISKRLDLINQLKVDEKLFEKFVNINENFFHKIIQKFSPTCIFDHEDYFQTSLIALYNLIEKYDETRGAFSTFVFTCIYNDVLQEINKGNKISKQEVSMEKFLRSNEVGGNYEYNEAVFDHHATQYDFENSLIAKFEIQEFMDKLEPIHKQIFDRRVIKKMKHREVAENLGLNYHTYKHIWHYSVSPKIKKLQEKIFSK